MAQFLDSSNHIDMPLFDTNELQWIWLNIKTIKNHEVKSDILLLIDWWEHAWILDYGSDKKKYLKDIWKIINWNVISTRLGKSWSA